MTSLKVQSILVQAILAAVIPFAAGTAAAQQSADAARARGLDTAVHGQAVAALEADPGLSRNPFAVLVRFEPGAEHAVALTAAAAATMRQYKIVPGLELVHTDLPPEAAVAVLRLMPGVAYAEPDFVVRALDDPPQSIPDDTYFTFQWGADNTGQDPFDGTPGADVNAPAAWSVTTGDPGFVVAIIDGGVQYSHADLAANAWVNAGEVAGNGIDDDGNGYADDVYGWDFYDGDNDPMDESDIGHGTLVAGVAGASGNNGIGVAGMMWQCRLMALRFLGPGGDGLISDAISALEYATAKGVTVSNHSWGYNSPNGSSSLYDAIAAAGAAGHIVVAAAGNDGKNNDGHKSEYPASYDLDNIISVAATDENDGLASFSNYGQTTVDLAAPGVNILSSVLTTLYGPGPYPYGIYTYATGTSLSAPYVAGVVGLVWTQHPAWTWQQVRAQILDTARPVASLANKTASGGVLDAAAALGVAVPPPPPPPPAPPAAPGTPTLTNLGGGQVEVSWADNSDNEDGFEVERKKKSGPQWIEQQIVADVPADTTTVTDAPGSGIFRYRVRAYNAVGESAWSGWRQINVN